MGEHAISFKYIAGFPSRLCNGGLQHAVDLIAQFAQISDDDSVDEEPEAKPSPFAALKALKEQPDN